MYSKVVIKTPDFLFQEFARCFSNTGSCVLSRSVLQVSLCNFAETTGKCYFQDLQINLPMQVGLSAHIITTYQQFQNFKLATDESIWKFSVVIGLTDKLCIVVGAAWFLQQQIKFGDRTHTISFVVLLICTIQTNLTFMNMCY